MKSFLFMWCHPKFPPPLIYPHKTTALSHRLLIADVQIRSFQPLCNNSIFVVTTTWILNCRSIAPDFRWSPKPGYDVTCLIYLREIMGFTLVYYLWVLLLQIICFNNFKKSFLFWVLVNLRCFCFREVDKVGCFEDELESWIV